MVRLRLLLICYRFKLSDPPESGDVQELLGIKGEGSFVISAKVDNRGVSSLVAWPQQCVPTSCDHNQ
jgi:hypothetical protein